MNPNPKNLAPHEILTALYSKFGLKTDAITFLEDQVKPKQ